MNDIHINSNPIKTLIDLRSNMESDIIFPLSHTALQAITTTYAWSSDDDMVRVCETDGNSVHVHTATFEAPAWADIEKTHNVRDQALAEALAFYGAWWDNTIPGNTTKSYIDEHGAWCVECGNSVYTGDNGEHVCSNASCINYDADNCPAWVKELHNVA